MFCETEFLRHFFLLLLFLLYPILIINKLITTTTIYTTALYAYTIIHKKSHTYMGRTSKQHTFFSLSCIHTTRISNNNIFKSHTLYGETVVSTQLWEEQANNTHFFHHNTHTHTHTPISNKNIHQLTHILQQQHSTMH